MTSDAEKLLNFIHDKLRGRNERELVFKAEDLQEIADAQTKIDRLLEELKKAQSIETYEFFSNRGIRVRLFPNQSTQSDKKVNTSPKGRNKTLVDREIDDLVKNKFLKEREHNIQMSLETLNSYSHLFHYFICVQNDRSVKVDVDNYFEFIANKVHEANNEDYIKVLGPDGTGKSTFLSILYRYLYYKFSKGTLTEYPFYINLHYYDSNITNADSMEELNRMVEEEMREDLNILVTYSQKNPNTNFMIIIDGNDEYDRSKLKSGTFLENILKQIKGHKKIICLGERTNIHFYKERGDSNFIDKTTTYTFFFSPIFMSEKSKQTEVIQEFCKMFHNQNQVSNIISCIEKFKIKEIDHNLLTVFCDVSKKTNLENISSVSELYYQYCLDYLEGDDKKLEISVNLAYQYFMTKDFITQHDIAIHWREWELVHQHKTISNYLLAVYYAKLIQRGAVDDVGQFEYIFTNGINVFLKSLLNRGREKQKKTLVFCRKLFDKGGFMAQSQAAYLVGRIRNSDLQRTAQNMLQEQLRNWNLREARDNKARRERYFVKRSILVSLLYLGDYTAGETLLKDLFEIPLMNEVNRAFYLQYYEDITDMETEKVNLEDNGKCRITNTTSVLFNYINLHLLKKESEGTWSEKELFEFQIQLFTICSLLQQRMYKSQIAMEVEKLSDVISRTLRDYKSDLADSMQAYITMLQEDIKKGSYRSEGHLYDELYALKELQRAGWLKKIKAGSIQVDRYENVVEHTYYAWLLGMLYLPDDKPAGNAYKKYEKKKVLNCLLIHDLAETYVGDMLPEDKTNEAKEAEKERMQEIFMHDTYPGIGDMKAYKKIWEEFESDSKDINGRIAKDLDKIQAIYQFCVYKRMGAVFDEKKEAEWRKEKNKIKTFLGKEILNKIVLKPFKDILSPDHNT
ncbi:MAG: HD domain-containing protein [Candidatus Gastranaerophilales bacterium]|nr:HD domain-containing protein [Candidatus Gastranaerophilales bacterium]